MTMTDITLSNINSGYNLNKINDNFQTIQEVVNDELLHTKGGNNTMEQALDMNSNRILNLPNALSNQEPVTKGQMDYEVDVLSATVAALASSEYGSADNVAYTDTDGTVRTVKEVLDSNAGMTYTAVEGLEDIATLDLTAYKYAKFYYHSSATDGKSASLVKNNSASWTALSVGYGAVRFIDSQGNKWERVLTDNTVDLGWWPNADPTGTVDSTDAIADAFDFYTTLISGSSIQNEGYLGVSWPTLMFEDGKYLSGPISTPNSLIMKSKGKTIIRSLTYDAGTLTPAGGWINNPVIYGRIEDFKFIGFDSVLVWYTNNTDMARHELYRVEAAYCNVVLDQVSYALSRSTVTMIDNCRSSYGVRQFAKIHSDKSTVSNGWFIQSVDESNLFHIDSLCSFENNIIIPVGVTGFDRALIHFEASDQERSLVIDTCRFGGEPGQSAIVTIGSVNPNNISNAYRNQGVTIRNSVLRSLRPYDPDSIGPVVANVILLETPGPTNSIQYLTLENCGSSPDRAPGAVQYYGTAPVTDVFSSAFAITMDRNTAQAFSRGVNTPVSAELRRYVAAPMLSNTFWGPTRDSGRCVVADTATPGQKKVSFQMSFRYPASYFTPMAFLVTLQGEGDTSLNNFAYGYNSVYIVTVSGGESGGTRAQVSVTKLHGSAGGASLGANADIISAHFGTGDTGSSTLALSGAGTYTAVDVTIAFGTRVLNGKAHIKPLNDPLGLI